MASIKDFPGFMVELQCTKKRLDTGVPLVRDFTKVHYRQAQDLRVTDEDIE
eukprot:CAMPEP_0185790412 /NCGR_PEP_ID=MMETSP1174-20130828/156216_1 /TAXON_ID=35687 /ORGANISM="Dictyocha speculum, Strain CCMP1381" /LENGTH=50 /DNA_ID=CAMNT_0028485099 /DNA_START=636 /DNA_END=788 /DNA_ORIENTATION=+